MNFKQIIVTIDSKSAETISDIFFELGALSVTVEDAHAGTDLEKPIFDEPGQRTTDDMWQDSTVTILTASGTDTSIWVKNIETLIGQKLNYKVEILEDEDWVRKTQSQFNPIKVSDNLYIVPSWHKSPDNAAITITLDPGLAFGTGSHPTTFMCLEWLAHNTQNAKNLLDYGCGSGILAITAKKLGILDVYGIDIDPLAIESSLNNAKQNQVSVEFCLPDKMPTQKFDIVVANILSNPLRMLAPAIANHTQDKLILSGILDEQASELSEIYSQWFTVRVAKVMDGWALLECIKK